VTGAIAFVQMLDKHGVGVAYDPPFDSRSSLGDPNAVIIYYHLTAADDVINAVRVEFERSPHADAGSVTPETSHDEAQNDERPPLLS
jgi:hypothetical protein